MTRRRDDDPLERALVLPARLISGYAAAVTTWPVVRWLMHDRQRTDPPWLWIGLGALMTLLWWLAGRRQRALTARDAPSARSDPGQGRP